MENFFTHECFKCGGIDEANFEICGPHIKQVCLHCGCYVKFRSKMEIPPLGEIRKKIWETTGGDLNIISKAKEMSGFTEKYEDVKTALVGWWSIYIKSRSLTPSK